MHELLTYLKARIEWCRRQGKTADDVQEQRGWRAEEAGLVDALRGRLSSSFSPDSFGEHLARYHLGLQEGSAIMRLIEPHTKRETGDGGHHEGRRNEKGESRKGGSRPGQLPQPSRLSSSSPGEIDETPHDSPG